jgi:hypothetical protein
MRARPLPIPVMFDAVVFTDLNATVQTYRIVRGIVLFQPARSSDRRVTLARQAWANRRLLVHRDRRAR